jgi:hypothetical protein
MASAWPKYDGPLFEGDVLRLKKTLSKFFDNFAYPLQQTERPLMRGREQGEGLSSEKEPSIMSI